MYTFTLINLYAFAPVNLLSVYLSRLEPSEVGGKNSLCPYNSYILFKLIPPTSVRPSSDFHFQISQALPLALHQGYSLHCRGMNGWINTLKNNSRIETTSQIFILNPIGSNLTNTVHKIFISLKSVLFHHNWSIEATESTMHIFFSKLIFFFFSHFMKCMQYLMALYIFSILLFKFPW